VAEDNQMNVIVIRKMLESLHYYNFKVVNDGQEALNAVKSEPFDLILMDVMMPVMGGIESTERIREEIPKMNQPVIIAVTANAFPENKERCLRSGMNYVLTKPLSRQILLETIQRFFPE